MQTGSLCPADILGLLVPPPRPKTEGLVARLTDADWQSLVALGTAHRFLPLLRYRLTEASLLDRVPPGTRAQLDTALRQQTLRVLRMQQALLETHRHLQTAGIPHLFLKGAYLAFRVYPHPALRPLRDLDVLVHPHHAEAAFAHLRDQGFGPRAEAHEHLAAAIATHKHLPVLQSPRGAVPLELHLRLARPDRPLARADWWARSVTAPVGTAHAGFLAPEDLVVHLAVHAAEEHGFDNGPLTLTDLGFLITRGGLDWDRVWDRAAEVSALPALTLCLRLTRTFHEGLEIPYPAQAPETPPALLQTVQALCLRHTGAVRTVNLSADLHLAGSMGNRARVLARRILPRPAVLSNRYGVPQGSARLWLAYPRLWGTLLRQRLPQILRHRGASVSTEAKDLVRLRRWLSAP